MALRGAMLAVALTVLAARSDAESPDRRSVYGGVEIGNTETRRLLAGVMLQWNAWEVDAQLARADFQLPDIEARSTAASAGLKHDFGQWYAGGGARRSELENVSTTSGWYADLAYRFDTVRLSLEWEARRTRLEPTPFTEVLGGELGVRTGTSRCEVGSRGYQARADLDRPSWLGFVSLRTFDYRDFSCSLALAGSGNGPPTHARGRALGRRLGEQSLQVVNGFASRLIPREALLLDSSLALGVTLPVDEHWIGGAEIYRDIEETGSRYDTALLFASRPLDDTWTVELSFGFSDAEDVRDTAFAGIRMSADL